MRCSSGRWWSQPGKSALVRPATRELARPGRREAPPTSQAARSRVPPALAGAKGCQGWAGASTSTRRSRPRARARTVGHGDRRRTPPVAHADGPTAPAGAGWPGRSPGPAGVTGAPGIDEPRPERFGRQEAAQTARVLPTARLISLPIAAGCWSGSTPPRPPPPPRAGPQPPASCVHPRRDLGLRQPRRLPLPVQLLRRPGAAPLARPSGAAPSRGPRPARGQLPASPALSCPTHPFPAARPSRRDPAGKVLRPRAFPLPATVTTARTTRPEHTSPREKSMLAAWASVLVVPFSARLGAWRGGGEHAPAERRDCFLT